MKTALAFARNLALWLGLSTILGFALAAFAEGWDSKFYFVGKFTSSNANASFTLPNTMAGKYVKVLCHDNGEPYPVPVDAYLATGYSDGGIGKGAGPGCKQADAGYACPIVRFSLGEVFYSRMLANETTIHGFVADGGNCDVFTAGN